MLHIFSIYNIKVKDITYILKEYIFQSFKKANTKKPGIIYLNLVDSTEVSQIVRSICHVRCRNISIPLFVHICQGLLRDSGVSILHWARREPTPTVGLSGTAGAASTDSRYPQRRLSLADMKFLSEKRQLAKCASCNTLSGLRHAKIEIPQQIF